MYASVIFEGRHKNSNRTGKILNCYSGMATSSVFFKVGGGGKVKVI